MEQVTKVFRRLDSDGDGKLTVLEFKNGLKRLRIANLKKWNNRLIRRLFDECDRNKDGLLDITEFFGFVRGDFSKTSEDLKSSSFKNKLDEGDELDDIKIFNAQRKISDSELFRKVIYV